jgi:hypothetical protein
MTLESVPDIPDRPPTEAEALGMENQRRLNAIAAQRMQIPVDFVRMYHERLLEALVGDRLEELRLAHQQAIVKILDDAESQIRKAQLLAGTPAAGPTIQGGIG